MWFLKGCTIPHGVVVTVTGKLSVVGWRGRGVLESNSSTRLESILKPDSTLGTRYTEIQGSESLRRNLHLVRFPTRWAAGNGRKWISGLERPARRD